MILFYIKSTGKIIGTVEGRVHPQSIIDNFHVVPSGYTKEQIGKFVVPYVARKEMAEEPVYKMKLNRETDEVERVEVGKQKVEKTIELMPSGPFSDMIVDFENKSRRALACAVKTNDAGEVVGIEEI